MRAQSSSFDVARIVDELRGMIGVRARKAYQPHYEQVVLRLNQKGKPSTDLVIVRGKRIYLSQRDRPMPTNPSPFAMKLRKHLSNSRLIEVNQFIINDKEVDLELKKKLEKKLNKFILDQTLSSEIKLELIVLPYLIIIINNIINIKDI